MRGSEEEGRGWGGGEGGKMVIMVINAHFSSGLSDLSGVLYSMLPEIRGGYLGSSLIDFCISTGKRSWLSPRKARFSS